MKKPIFILAAFVLSGCGTPIGDGAAVSPAGRVPQAIGQSGTPRIFVRGHELMISSGIGNAQPVFLKGVNYAPTPICQGPLDNPLGNNNSVIWRRDLPHLRQLGINALKVYNANPNADPITNFLNAAYNNGTRPIYVILSIFFPPTAPLDKGAVADLAEQYRKLARDNGANPAVIGMSISSEVNAEDFRSNPDWWAGMSTIARAAKDGFTKAGHPEKIITTTLVDDGFITERAGEKNNFPADAWGINFYTGSTFGTKFTEYTRVSSKPLIVSEWGTPESWHPNGNPNRAIEFPANKVNLLTSYIGGLADELYQNSSPKGGVVAGGFYFEFNDEWWKAHDKCIQLPNPEAPNPKFPGGFGDEAWFGLNSIAQGNPNVITKRPAYTTLRMKFAGQQ